MRHYFLRRYDHEKLSEYTHEQLSKYPDLVFIYNRTQEDVDRVKELNEKYQNRTITDEEKQEWNTNMIGALNVFDIERVEYNADFIAYFFGKQLDTRVWRMGDIPRVSDYRRIRENVAELRDMFPATMLSIPLVPECPLNTWQKWNAIEKILYMLYTMHMGMTENLHYCDTEIYAGEGDAGF